MTTTTPEHTDAVLREEDAEAALVELAEKVAQAEQNLTLVLKDNPGRTWTMRDLQDEAAGGLSSSVMSIAFLRLLKADALRVDYSTQAVQAA